MIPLSILVIESDSDRAFMSSLYLQYYPFMFMMAQRYFDQPSDVEDVVSASCEALIRNINTLRSIDQSVLKSYILATTRNTAISSLRHKLCRDKHIVLEVDEDIYQIPVEAVAERRLIISEDIELVLLAIEKLSTRDQDILRMKFYEHMSDYDISVQFGITEGAVRKVIERSRKRLKATLFGR